MSIFTWLKIKKINCSESQNVAYEEDDVCPDYGGNRSSRNDNHYSADNGYEYVDNERYEACCERCYGTEKYYRRKY